MAAKDHTLEEIKYYTELLRFVWILLLGIGGSTVSLAAATTESWKPILVMVGFLSVMLIGAGFGLLNRRVRALIRELRET